MYPQCKSKTWKILVGCTPSGPVSFVSEARGRRISNCEIREKTRLLEKEDMIMVDVDLTHTRIKSNVRECASSARFSVLLTLRKSGEFCRMPCSHKVIGQGCQYESLHQKFSNVMSGLVSELYRTQSHHSTFMTAISHCTWALVLMFLTSPNTYIKWRIASYTMMHTGTKVKYFIIEGTTSRWTFMQQYMFNKPIILMDLKALSECLSKDLFLVFFTVNDQRGIYINL